MTRRVCRGLLVLAALILAWGSDGADALDEFKVKRPGPFEFAEKPTVTRDGDRVTIGFKAAGFCDATVAVEDENGRIIRHLAGGVLGPNAPVPFEKNSLEQTIVWDGKNDRGTYIDDKGSLTVRVSLGLKPRFERTLFWVPRRRGGPARPLFGATEEGVYVYNGGQAMDSVILYDRDGNYVRTVYPFPRPKLDEARGLVRHTFPQDGKTLPLKTNFLQCTMLSSGTNGGILKRIFEGVEIERETVSSRTAHWGMYGAAARSIDVRAGRIAMVYRYLNRLGTEGATAGLPLHGPRTSLPVTYRRHTQQVSPYSVALGPKGKWLYLTGYHFGRTHKATQDIQKLTDIRTLPVVMRLDMEANKEPEVFKGIADIEQAGTDNEHFKVPTSVDVDDQGRVYVGDYMNDRVQVLDASGKHLKTIRAYRPAHVEIHRKTGHLFVFSWWVRNQYEDKHVKRMMVEYGPFEKPTKLRSVPIAPQGRFATGWGARCPVEFSVELDSWSDPIRIWIAEPWTGANVLNRGRIQRSNVEVRELRGEEFALVHSFNRDVKRKGAHVKAPIYYRQRLYVNPENGRCYVAEGDDSAVGKSFRELHELDPHTGRVRRIQLPFDAEDMCFDLDGLAYLRSINFLARYDPKSWREVPWDYGEEREGVGYGWMSSTRKAKVAAGLLMPANGNWHHGGMAISARGHLVVACGLNISTQVRTRAKYVHRGKTYTPRLYPGRLIDGRCGGTTLHVWDRHGKVVREDIVPGLSNLYGVGSDEDDNFYAMSSATRVFDEGTYFNRMTGTLVKFPAGEGRVLTKKGARIPLSESQYPDRPVDVSSGPQGPAWMQDAEWLYGGVGYSGGNGGGCSCWNARFKLDDFARSFAPEMQHYSIAVLDSAGNLILRVGEYGNVDDGVPLVTEGGPENPRSIGGDEVALFHAPYVATHTDRRLYIADPGNARILSVRLGYHATETTALKDVPDKAE
ncbi:MAG: hypothetical protein ACOC8E_00700 [Planctomycetota bacterium]